MTEPPKPPDLIYVVMSVARQENGEMIFVRSEKAFVDKGKAEVLAKSLSNVVRDNIEVPNVGPVACSFERGVYAVQVEV